VNALETEFKDSTSRIAVCSKEVLSMLELCNTARKSFPQIPFASIEMPGTIDLLFCKENSDFPIFRRVSVFGVFVGQALVLWVFEK
jgi:hypothetical protein